MQTIFVGPARKLGKIEVEKGTKDAQINVSNQ